MIPGDEALAKAALEVWTIAMLGFWEAGLWMLKVALTLIDAFLVPDVSADGPGRAVYGVAFWLAGALVTILLMVQLGVAVLRRDGAALAAALTGAAKFLAVWAGWLAYGAAFIAACGGLTQALLRELLAVESWSAWEPFGDLKVEDVTDATVATVLGLMGLLLWLASIGHLVVMITRAGALLVLAAMTPAAAAGLVGEAGRAWFWKSLRWFHAAALTPVLMVLTLGTGVQLTSGVVTDQTGPAAAVGTALPGVVLILVSCVTPLALFRLLAFVDPTTPSGGAARAAWAASIGLNQLSRWSGSGGGSATETSGATPTAGGSAGEATATDTTEKRLVAAETGLLTAAGPAGVAAAAGLEAVQTAGTSTAATGADQSADMGAGQPSDQPSPAPTPADRSQSAAAPPDLGQLPETAGAPGPTPPAEVADAPAPAGAAPGSEGAASDGAAARTAAVAARVPIVPV